MTREWKPGDVAMIEVGCHANRHVGIFEARGWRYDGKWAANDPAIVSARPLVALDPEDREQVWRIVRAYYGPDSEYPGLSESEAVCVSMQAALRSLITPPKPEEPTGLGAVVVDAEGDLWVRFSCTDDEPWCSEPYADRDYVDIAAVKVLGPGVTP